MNKQMKIDETRAFKIHISKKVYCGENPKDGSKAIEIKIKKVRLNSNDCKDCSRFEMIGKEQDVYLTCKPGYLCKCQRTNERLRHLTDTYTTVFERTQHT